MYNLVLKDLIIQKKSVKNFSVSLIFSMVFIQFFGASSIYIITPVFFAISFIANGCGFGEKNDVDRMIGSFPVSRKEIVFSKYLSALILFIIAIVITVVFATITKLSGLSNINRFMNLQDIMIAFVFTVFYNAIYLPVYLWLGNLKSQLINTILNFCIAICLIVTVVIVSIIDNGTAKDSIMNFVSMPNFQLFVFISCICFSIILSSISIGISLKIYLSKDL